MMLSINQKRADEIKSTSIAAKANIEILPSHIIDQIKAGEVLERPASLLKELIENSIDANSSEINIHLVDNGLSLLSIEDNGEGINFSNLPKAFLRHATSKLRRYEDIYTLHSFGFRGEALASLASSARITCVSQPVNLAETGGKIIIHGGKEELLIAQSSVQNGTSLFLKDLFYNTPARLKFIKSKNSEKIQLKKILYSFIISNPDIQFQVKWDDKEKEFYKKFTTTDFLKRIENIFPAGSSVFSAQESYLNYRINVFFTKDAKRAGGSKNQYLFINKRYFSDKTLHQAILRNLESIWHYGEAGHYVVLIEAPPESIDVNVHPNKTQIKFIDTDIIYSLLVSAIKSALKAQLKNATTSLELFESESIKPSHHINQFSEMVLHNTGLSSIHTPEEKNKSFFIIENAYAISVDKNENWVINLKILTDSVIISLLEACSTNDELISPLLVSEPFPFQHKDIDKYFSSLRKLGFEFDRLSNETVILRTTPKYLPRSILNFTALALLNSYHPENKDFKLNNFSHILKKIELNQIVFTEPLIKALLQLTHKETNSYMLKLNKANLGSLFK